MEMKLPVSYFRKIGNAISQLVVHVVSRFNDPRSHTTTEEDYCGYSW